MPAETTATLLLGPVTRMMPGTRGTMRAQTLLALDEGSRACWRVVELDEAGPTVCGVADAPERLLVHGLLAFLVSRAGDVFNVSDNPELGSLALRSQDGRRIQTRTTPTTSHAIAAALGEQLAVVATVFPGSTITAGEVAELAALGVRIELAA